MKAACDIEQLPPDAVVGGARVRAAVGVGAAELRRRGQVEWTDGADETGPVKTAVVQAKAGGPALVLIATDQPIAEATVLAAAETTERSIRAVLAALGVEDREILGFTGGPAEPVPLITTRGARPR